MANDLTKEKLKVIGQILISLVGLGIGGALVAWCEAPEGKTTGGGLIGAVIGYWTR